MKYLISGNRIEDFFFEKIDKKKPNRLSNLEYVGMDMIEAGNDFGPGIAYGSNKRYFLFNSLILTSLSLISLILYHRQCTDKSWPVSTKIRSNREKFHRSGS